MRKLIAIVAIAAAATSLFAADKPADSEITVTGKVVALRNLADELTAVKLLGKDGRIYTVKLDEKGRALAAEAKLIVEVKGWAAETKPQDDKPAAWTLEVKSFQRVLAADSSGAATPRMR